MCKFFSVTSDGLGHVKYFDSEIRKKIISGELDYETDSHTSINDYFGFKGEKEDGRNKYEFNPLTKIFTIDQINGKDDSKAVNLQLLEMDWLKIVPELIVKPIINPFETHNELTDADMTDLRLWDSVGASVRASVGASVRASVGASVWASVGASVGASIWASIWASVRASVGASIWASVRDSVGASVWDSVGASIWASVGASVRDSVGAYLSSFFNIPYQHDFSSCIRLWERGFVPSFDGTTWRLHAGKDAKIVYEYKKED